MRETPPAQLTALLQRLKLAEPREVEIVEGVVRRLADDLPRFESVWIDALRQARLLTQLQASEIRIGRGDALRVDRFILCEVIQQCGFVTIYKAEDVEVHAPVRLTIATPPPARNLAAIPALETLIDLGKRLPQLSGLVTSAGQDETRLWTAAPWIDGTSLAEWILHHGRFPPEITLEVARAMVYDLSAMETVGLVHGDIRVENVLMLAGYSLASRGICLPQAGVRGIIRPREGIAHCDLAPEPCGALAPERIVSGTPPTVASDLFACGCVWWQMLCGRPPLGGGDTLARLRVAQNATIEDFRLWTTDVPPPLADAITACLKRDPSQRPRSMAALAQLLGPSQRSGRQAIARFLSTAAQRRAPWLQAKRVRATRTHPHLWTGATLALLGLFAFLWPLWVAANRAKSRESASEFAQREPMGSADRSRESPRPTPGELTKNGPATPSSDVVRAEYSDSSEAPSLADTSAESGKLVLLANDRTISADSLQFKSGQTVRPRHGRVRVAVPSGGLPVRGDRLTFENIDFVPGQSAVTYSNRALETSALIRLSCPECTFLGCSFQAVAGLPERITAIRWEQQSASIDTAGSLPAGRLRLKNCVFRRVAAGIESSRRGAVSLEIVNTLHLGPGPLVRLEYCPAADEPWRISLAQVTLRKADSLVELRLGAGRDDVPLGEIGIDASGCAFSLSDAAAVLVLVCNQPPQPLLEKVKWTGQGSAISPQAAFGHWRRQNGPPQSVDDATMSISGLARGRIEFADRYDGNPANSRITRCQGPIEDAAAVGANPSYLPPDVDLSTQ